MLTLAELPAAYAAARAEVQAHARPVAAGLCRYCDRRWTPLWCSGLDGHALCVVTPGFREAISALHASSAAITHRRLADLLGVSVKTIAAWIGPRTIERGPRWAVGRRRKVRACEPTPEGLRALQFRPMTQAEIDDLVARVREADRQAAAESQEAAARASRKRSPQRIAEAKRERTFARDVARAYARTLRVPDRIRSIASASARRAAVPQFPPGATYPCCGGPAVGAIAGSGHRCETGPPRTELAPPIATATTTT